ncbi:MAG TPA: PCMD domain-containing protein [Candidatus Prevotella intestinigallinarum]|nr:PCMD domain-containing protein [Candidatus Prevotella intestinigallinarum]
MKLHKLFLLATVCCTLSACFKDEPANAECDIEAAWIHFDNPAECVWNLNDTIINVSSTTTDIRFEVRAGTDLTALAPEFKTTAGATITPKSGTVLDFSKAPVQYTVTSEDEAWHREYKVSITERRHTTNDTLNFDFENYYLYQEPNSSSSYYIWSDYLNEDGSQANNWATGNAGFKLTNYLAKPEEYPTIPLADGGVSGDAVMLVTRKTGAIGAAYRKPIAAGNLFLGTFIGDNALLKPMEATQFGLPFDRTPIKFTGYYQYTPGETFTNQDGNVVNGKVDAGDIYAVLYINHDADGNPFVLTGDNVLTSEQIVLLARVPNVEPTDGWTYFELEFEKRNGKEIDLDLLNGFGYNLAVVFSSSVDGAYFQGAENSTLIIDNVRVICEKTE